MVNKFILFFALGFSFSSVASVDYNHEPYALPHDVLPSCLGNGYFEVGFWTNFESNNDNFQIQRSLDQNFSWAISSTALFNGYIDGCGTCGQRQYSVNDYGPFLDGEIWYYRIKSISNSGNVSYKEFNQPVYINSPSTIDWTSQVTSQVENGSSPADESVYQWHSESRNTQGVSISLMPTEVSKIYLEQNNHKINFNVQVYTPILNIDVSINNGGFTNIVSGSIITNFVWENATSYFTTLGNYNLKVRFTSTAGTIFYREYDVYVVPKSDELFVDNYCNTMRLWKGGDQLNGTPLVFSEGFDAYNTKSEQYYRETGDNLIDCMLNKGIDIYIINYNLNSQSIKNNGAIFQSAVRYVSSINSNINVIAAGMSMGGLINRYACAKAENDGNPLPISKFLSIDAPQQGAVISEPFQIWMYDHLQISGDTYAQHALNNDAAKELLLYNAYDLLAHDQFFNYLNGLNGDGYPHLIEKIGVSFSTEIPNPNSGNWLTIDITGVPNVTNESFDLTDNEKLSGSYLPLINSDPSSAFSPFHLESVVLSYFRPFSDPTVTVIQYSDPTFIPHNSSLDIISGTSKFDKVIMPAITGYHDVVPNDIIEPLINALIQKQVYVQNISYYDYRTIIASELIAAGNSVLLTQPTGDVNINSGAEITFKSGIDIQLNSGFNVQPGAIFHAVIESVACDGNVEFQNKTVNSGDDNGKHLSEIEQHHDSSTYIVYDTNRFENDNINIDETSKILIYPNPSKGEITVKYFSFSNEEVNSLEYFVYNLNGKEILSGISLETQFNLNLPVGAYILKVIADEITTSHKVFIH